MPSIPRRSVVTSVNFSLILLAFPAGYLIWRHLNTPHASVHAEPPSLPPQYNRPAYETAGVLISYGYFEKDAGQAANFEFFLAAGTTPPDDQTMHWCFVISTPQCGPCRALTNKLGDPKPGLPNLGIASIQEDKKFTVLFRTENVGMDIALHNITLEFMAARKRIGLYKYFVFINSSVKGPFYPGYMPPGWHWTHAYLSRFRGDIHAVGSSLTCLPDVDAGGPGPRLESWAYAVDTLGLEVMLEGEVLHIRTCKLCSGSEGIVVAGEYGMTMSMLEAGYNIATLMTKYREGVDWRDRYHWNCNDNIHPSRHGTYDRIGFHPYETIFVKASWHVADPYTSRYGRWKTLHLQGSDGTEGEFDPAMYHYSVSLEAQEPNDLELAYDVTKFRKFFKDPSIARAAIVRGINQKQSAISTMGSSTKVKRRINRTRLGGIYSGGV